MKPATNADGARLVDERLRADTTAFKALVRAAVALNLS